MRSVLAALTLVVVTLFVGAGTAAAHSELVSSDPAADTVFDAPLAGVTLVFNQNIAREFAYVSVTGIDGVQWAAPDVRVENERVRGDIVGEIPPGRYTIAYRVVSEDGHPISGSYGFDFAYRYPDTEVAKSAPSDGQPASTGAAAPDAAPTASDNKAIMWVLGAAAAGLLVGGTYIALRGTGKKRD